MVENLGFSQPFTARLRQSEGCLDVYSEEPMWQTAHRAQLSARHTYNHDEGISVKPSFVRLGLATLLAIIATAAAAQEKTLRIATQNPRGHPIVLGLERFAELVEARSRGRVKVMVFPGGTLGSDEVSIAALQAGTLEMASLNSGILANQVKAFAVFDLPLLLSGDGDADALLDGPFGRSMHDALHDKGLVGLAYYELGFRQITNSLRPIHTVADLQGLKLRVIPTPLNLDWVRALGAQAVPIPFPDVYAALETKAVDGQDNPVTVIDANRFDRVQKYLLLSRHQYNPQSVLISKKVWDGLDAAHRSMLADAARESAAFQRGRARSMEGAALENLRKHGMVVTRLPDGEARKMADLLRPVTDKTLKALPPGVVAGLKQARGASTGK